MGPIGSPVNLFLAIAVGLTVILNLFAVVMVRIWNPSREARQTVEETAPESIWGFENELGQREKAASPVEVEHAVVTSTTIGDLAAAATRRRQISQARRSAAPAGKLATRQVWDNPIVWREIRTWAYGRRVLVMRLAYLLLFALAAAALATFVNSSTGLTARLGRPGSRAAVRGQPAAGQCPGRHLAHQRARRQSPRFAAGHRYHAQ